MTKKEFFKKYYNCKPEKFNWKNNSRELCTLYYDKFNQWWDPEKFNWVDCFYLCIYCYNNFEVWWDPDKFKYTWVDYLYYYCIEYKYIWEPYVLLNKI